MKVLFAVSNESISESIIKKYQQEYKEIISSKNVYYFNAIVKEIQKDKSYDRIVISEDLEPFANNNYEVIDKFIFEKLDSISDEATSVNGQDIPIILICADRRNKSESFLAKIFGIGIYSALLGQDRSITKVCELINKPRSKKDAKVYYRIDSDDVDYKSEGEGDVSEIEIQNILNHYRRLGKNEEKYVDSFNNIASQYTDAQLRVICKFLPLNVKAVLEANSSKYQELITFGTVTPSISVSNKKMQQNKYVPNSDYQKAVNSRKRAAEKNASQLDIIEKNIGKSTLTKPVIIPSSMDISNVKKVSKKSTQVEQPQVEVKPKETIDNLGFEDFENIETISSTTTTSEIAKTPEKKKRGRPRKVQPEEDVAKNSPKVEEAPKKKRGRPRKVQPQEEPEETEATILPGFSDEEDEREEIASEAVNLFDLGNEEDEEPIVPEKTGGIILPGFEEDDEANQDEEYDNVENNELEDEFIDEEPKVQNQGFKREEQYETKNFERTSYDMPNNNTREIDNINQYIDINLDSLLTRDKKVVAFVGTSKNGTSFLVNNLAEVLSKKGIRTAILDLTKNKNAYYIYTQNEEELRKRAFSCIVNLKKGIAEGIQVNKNLTVFTTLPGEDPDINDYQSILTTLVQNYSLVLMDCDFETNYGYFKNAQEIYLTQSFDILTIQPLTAFLRDLKTKNILNPEKLRIVLNKVLRVRSITERMIIGGMAFYNDPAMSFMTELFNKDTIKYCTIPFEEQTYSRYLEGLVNCQISTNGYSKNFMISLDRLASMVYPLISGSNKNIGKLNSYNSSGFSNDMNQTLNRMKSNY